MAENFGQTQTNQRGIQDSNRGGPNRKDDKAGERQSREGRDDYPRKEIGEKGDKGIEKDSDGMKAGAEEQSLKGAYDEDADLED